MIEVDGAHGEGGGQILRTAVALSALYGEPVRVFNIRAKRRNPGLRPQHLNAVRAVALISGARVEGLRVGSREVVFWPGRPRRGRFNIDVGTAGSVTLILQAVLPVALEVGGVELRIRGGTDVPWSPTVDYFRFVFLELLRMHGAEIEVELLERGHYPVGGGMVRVFVGGWAAEKRFELEERGEILSVEGVAHVSNLPEDIARRMKHSALRILMDLMPKIRTEVWGRRNPRDRGAGIALWARTERSVLGSDALGAKGVPAERVGTEAAEKLKAELSGPGAVDAHASDMLLPYLARNGGTVAAGVLTSHAETMVWLLSLFGHEIRVDKGEKVVFRA